MEHMSVYTNKIIHVVQNFHNKKKSTTEKEIIFKNYYCTQTKCIILQNCVTYFTSESYRYDGTDEKKNRKKFWIPSYVQILTSTGVAKKTNEWMNVCIKWSSICFSFIDGMVLYAVQLYTISKAINQMHQPSVKPRLSTGRRVRDIIFFFV